MTDKEVHDGFAMAALTGLIASGQFDDNIAPGMAFCLADEMMKARAHHWYSEQPCREGDSIEIRTDDPIAHGRGPEMWRLAEVTEVKSYGVGMFDEHGIRIPVSYRVSFRWTHDAFGVAMGGVRGGSIIDLPEQASHFRLVKKR